MKQLTSSEWIAHFLAADPPRSKSLVMTIFGDTVNPHGGSVWLGSLIELAAPFGLSDRLVRTSVFRLAQEGWLLATRDGRRSAYEIHPSALPRFQHANHRIYEPLHAHWDGSWTLVICGTPGIEPRERARVRKELEWEGYAQLAPGVLGHPAGNAEVLADIIERTGLGGRLLACRAAAIPGAGGRDLASLVTDGWDLAPVVGAYRHFIGEFEPLAARLRQEELSPEQAYAVRTLLTHAYRRVQLHDPMLPVELLPDPWPGSAAYELARTIYRATFAAAETHIDAVLRREAPDVPPASPACHERFGGLSPVSRPLAQTR